MHLEFRKIAATFAAGMFALLMQASPAGAAVDWAHEHGVLEICNHSGYQYGVYADGPSARQADLGGFDECRHWTVRVGRYDIGFNRRVAGVDERVIAQARVERGPTTFYKEFDPRGVITTVVSSAYPTRVDLFIPQH
jgi:hypothetical protein